MISTSPLAMLFRSAQMSVDSMRKRDVILTTIKDFPGIFTCSIDDRLDTIFDTIRKSRVHRLVVVDEDNRLVGILTLSDILEYILLEGEADDGKAE